MRYKQRGRIGKWVLKKAMEPYLPPDLIYRPKSGFGAPLRRWVRHELRELVRDLLDPGSLKQHGLFDPHAVQQLISRNERGEIDAAYTIFAVLAIEIWCRVYLDRTQRVNQPSSGDVALRFTAFPQA
jgi:asparagine synthase (glutamine-hydrolysing)